MPLCHMPLPNSTVSKSSGRKWEETSENNQKRQNTDNSNNYNEKGAISCWSPNGQQQEIEVLSDDLMSFSVIGKLNASVAQAGWASLAT